MSKDERRPRAARRKERGDDEEGCCAGALDTCTHPCCAGWASTALLMALVRPGRTARGTQHDPVAPRPQGRVAGRMYDALRYYRTEVSPARPARCPYTPTCSTYAVRALHRHGALRGARLVLGRLLRCRPAVVRRRGPHDPVPHRTSPDRASGR
ncbi:membrane protein insertion efficiency factor YidD [Streptomyces tritici]|uniref:membrane protein insertion efficiency factor YidD n=1 Tax=Streptomyces tritici TaxID=2054410 RepID=UPI003AEFF12F